MTIDEKEVLKLCMVPGGASVHIVFGTGLAIFTRIAVRSGGNVYAGRRWIRTVQCRVRCGETRQLNFSVSFPEHGNQCRARYDRYGTAAQQAVEGIRRIPPRLNGSCISLGLAGQPELRSRGTCQYLTRFRIRVGHVRPASRRSNKGGLCCVRPPIRGHG